MRSSPIVELRQYTLHPGKRDVLVDLFEASFVEGQEAAGIEVIGTFRDLDDASKFVWLRGFRSMSQRARSLSDFYGGPVWKRHREAANATMIDSDDVLLLRPARAGSAFTLDGRRHDDRGIVVATILSLDAPADPQTLAHFDDEIAPLVAAASGAMLASFVTEPSANSFPALPIRVGESVFVYFAGFASRAAYEAADQEHSRVAGRMPRLESAPHVLRLEPTRRSRVTGNSSRKEEAKPMSDTATTFFVVLRRRGPEWDPAKPLEAQTDWPAHAAFMDQLVDDGFVVLGGPLADEERVVLAVEAESEDAVRATLAADPWSETHLRVDAIEPWTIRLDGRSRATPVSARA